MSGQQQQGEGRWITLKSGKRIFISDEGGKGGKGGITKSLESTIKAVKGFKDIYGPTSTGARYAVVTRGPKAFDIYAQELRGSLRMNPQ